MGSQGYNLLGDPQEASGWTNTDILHDNPLLGPLQNNGGPTQTIALLADSPALDAGDPAQANTADQRGVLHTGGVNIGAYQASATAFLVAGFPSPVNPGTSGSVIVTARDPYGNTAPGYRGTIHFTSSDPRALLAYDYTFTAADNGSHPFAAVLGTVGTQTLTATDTGNAAITGTQAGIVVTPGLPDHLQVVASMGSTVAGTPFDVIVTVLDRFNNTVTGYTGTVTFSSQDP